MTDAEDVAMSMWKRARDAGTPGYIVLLAIPKSDTNDFPHATMEFVQTFEEVCRQIDSGLLRYWDTDGVGHDSHTPRVTQ